MARRLRIRRRPGRVALEALAAISAAGLALSGTPRAAGAKTFYVAPFPTGNDANGGTSLGDGWATIQKCADTMQPGDSCQVQSGTYNQEVTITNSGDLGAWITYAADGNVMLDRQNKTGVAFQLLGASYIKISGFNISNYFQGINGDAFGARATHHVDVSRVHTRNTGGDGIIFRTNVSYINIDNVIVEYFGNHGILIFGYPYETAFNHHIAITNSIISNNTNDEQWHNAIDIHTNAQDVTLENNTIYGIRGGQTGFYVHNWNVSRVYLRSNHIYDSDRAMQFIGVRDSIIEANLIEDVDTYLVAIYQDTPGAEPNDNLIFRNNTLRNQNQWEGCVRMQRIYDNYNTNIIFDNNSITGCSNGQAYSLASDNNVKITIRNQIESTYKIEVGEAPPIDSFVEYTNGTVFNTNSGGALWYPDKSRAQITNLGVLQITAYPMTARPTSDVATVSVGTFDTTEGSTLIEFGANALNGNNVAFAISKLVAGMNYLVRKDGSDFATVQADETGTIAFDNSTWPATQFVVTETSGGSPMVTVPTFSPPSGTYPSSQSVGISTPTPGATTHYTVDGSAPTEVSPTYSAPIFVSSSTTLKARAWKPGYLPSAIGTAVYTIGVGAAGLGAPCNVDSDCLSANCVPGSSGKVCCASVCNSPCDAGTCSSDGVTCDPRVCPAPVDACQLAACDPVSGCNAASGAACDDGSACTTADVCDGSGACVGTAMDCSALDGVCVVGVCDSATGACITETAVDGTACGRGDPCVSSEVCAGGQCAGGENTCPGDGSIDHATGHPDPQGLGCSCSGGSSQSTALMLLALAGARAWRRRQRRSSCL